MTTLKDELQKLKTYNRPDTAEAWGRGTEKLLGGIIDVLGSLSQEVASLESRPVDGGSGKLAKAARQADKAWRDAEEKIAANSGHLETIGKLADSLGVNEEADREVGRLLVRMDKGDEMEPLDTPEETEPGDELVEALERISTNWSENPREEADTALRLLAYERASNAKRVAELEAELELAGQSVTESYEDELTALRERIAELESELAGKERAPDASLDTIAEELKHGGPWLGAAREWATWRVRGGDSLEWGSRKDVAIPFADLWEMAERVAEAAIREERKARARETLDVKEWWALEQKVERLESKLGIFGELTEVANGIWAREESTVREFAEQMHRVAPSKEVTSLREQIASLESQLEEAGKREEFPWDKFEEIQEREGHNMKTLAVMGIKPKADGYLCECCFGNGFTCDGCGHVGEPMPRGFVALGYVWDGDSRQLSGVELLDERDTLRRERDEARAEVTRWQKILDVRNKQLEDAGDAFQSEVASATKRAETAESSLAEVTRRFEGMHRELEAWADGQDPPRSSHCEIRAIRSRFHLPTEAPAIVWKTSIGDLYLRDGVHTIKVTGRARVVRIDGEIYSLHITEPTEPKEKES